MSTYDRIHLGCMVVTAIAAIVSIFYTSMIPVIVAGAAVIVLIVTMFVERAAMLEEREKRDN